MSDLFVTSVESAAERRPIRTRDASPAYGTVARLFHWTIALMVFIQIPAGIAMTTEQFPTIGGALFILHKGMGSVLLVLVTARLIWRLTHPVTPLLPHLPRLQRRIAALTHGTLYVLLVVQPVSGYIRTIGEGYPIELLDALGIPPLIPYMPETALAMLVVHKFCAYTLTVLIGAHVAAAIHHALIERDGVMSRIWPPWG